jgi:transcriptional regulator with XRE-family HTH domain
MSMHELGRKTGMSHVSIRRIETGESEWKESTLALISAALNTDIASLLGRHPAESEGIWSAWNSLDEAERRQIVEIARALKVASRRD